MRKGGWVAINRTGGLQFATQSVAESAENDVFGVWSGNRNAPARHLQYSVLLIAVSAIALGLCLHFAVGQEPEVPRPGASQPVAPPAEVPRAPTPTPAQQAPMPMAAATAQPRAAGGVDRELLSAKGCCQTCHLNDQMAAMLLRPEMTDAKLVESRFITSGPAELAEPRPADYRKRMFLDRDRFYRSAHGRFECIDCHDAITSPIHPQYIPNVKCDKCHASEQRMWDQGTHAKAVAKSDAQAPNCDRCHGNYHELETSASLRSPIHSLNSARLCAGCHADSGVLANHGVLKADAVETYLRTIHGEGIHRSGIPGSANCASCHGAHRNLNHLDAASSMSLQNTFFTCGACHVNNATSYSTSIHCRLLLAGDPNAPGCASCHPGHEVFRTNTAEFHLDSIRKCAECHLPQYETYLDTYHGRVVLHGGIETANCQDCHDYHSTPETTSPLSWTAPARIVETCRPCHSYSNEKFVRFISHLEPSDPQYPQTYYPWLFMTWLLLGTMGFFVVHSLLWLIRELCDVLTRGRGAAENHSASYRIQRFNLAHRITHAILFVSVIGLALTGLPLRYSHTKWGHWVFQMFGGHAAPAVLHRIFAALTILYVGIHFVYLWNLWRRAPKRPFWRTVFGPASMLPNWTDVKQFFQHVRWFLFMGPVPRFGRWTYYEKFDYWAVFWGVAIIGVSGLVMAVTPVSARLFPGWIFNVALIVHSDEALLAASFLFAIHFFHVHLRPQKFPIDHVMFSGSVTPHEMETERPTELGQLQAEGRLESLRVSPSSSLQLVMNRLIAVVTLLIGLALLAGIFWVEIVSRFFVRV